MNDKTRIVDADIVDIDPMSIEAEIEEVCPPDYEELLARAKARLQPPPSRPAPCLLGVSDPEPKWYKPCWPRTLSEDNTRLERMNIPRVANLVTLDEDVVTPGICLSLFIALTAAVFSVQTIGMSSTNAWKVFSAVAIVAFVFWVHLIGVYSMAKTRWENRNQWRTERVFGHTEVSWFATQLAHHHPPESESAMVLEYIVDSLRDIKERRVGPLSRLAQAIVRFNESVNTQKTRLGRIQNAIDGGNNDPVLARLRDTLAERLATDEAELQQYEKRRVEIGSFIDSAKDRLVRPFQTLRIIEECGIDAETEAAANEARAAVVAAIVDTNRDLANLATQTNTLVAGLQAKCLGQLAANASPTAFETRLALDVPDRQRVVTEVELEDAETSEFSSATATV